MHILPDLDTAPRDVDAGSMLIERKMDIVANLDQLVARNSPTAKLAWQGICVWTSHDGQSDEANRYRCYS
jgi:hypothetical protein